MTHVLLGDASISEVASGTDLYLSGHADPDSYLHFVRDMLGDTEAKAKRHH
jgi:hypothetical protein